MEHDPKDTVQSMLTALGRIKPEKLDEEQQRWFRQIDFDLWDFLETVEADEE